MKSENGVSARSAGERDYDDLDDFERVAGLFFQTPRNGFRAPLNMGAELVYNEDVGGWRVIDEDGAMIDVVFPDQWKSAQLLYRYICSVVDDWDDRRSDDGDHWRWSQ